MKYSNASVSTSAKYRFFSEDVLFGRLRSYLRKFWHADRDGICTTEIWPLMAISEQLEHDFLYFVVQTNRFIEAAGISYGTHMPRADWNILQNFEIRLPSVTEQRVIAEALSNVDGLIESLESLIAKKRDVKTAAMQQLLTGKTRLPGFRGEWKTKRLGEIANIDPENLSDDTNPDYEFNYISLEQVETGKLHGYTEETFRSSPSRARRKLRHNDVLMATVRPNLMGHLLFNEQFADTVCSTGFAVLRCKDCLSVPEFLFAHLLGSVVNKQIEAVLAGSNYPAISSCDVALVEIPCPPTVREQVAIGTILSDMDAEIAALECRLDKGRALKQGMVQQLLTGKIRLVDPA